MRFLIFIGFVTTLSAVSCKDHHHLHQRNNILSRRYKDNKNKRGIGDYSGFTYGGPSFQGFQTSAPTSISFIQDIPNFGAYGDYSSYSGINSLGHHSFNISPQPSSGFSNLGTHSLSSHNLGQPSNTGQNSGYTLHSPDLNFASLLGNTVSSQSSFLPSNTGLYSQMEKTGPITFNSQGSIASQSHSQYTPIYASGSRVGSNTYAIPMILGSSQGSNINEYRMFPSTLNSLNSQALSSSGGNGRSYSTSYVPLIGDSSSHVVTGGYILSATTPQQSAPLTSYRIPITALTSMPSTSEYTMTVPASYTSISSNPTYSNSSPSSNYQLPITAATFTSVPSSSSSDSTKHGLATSEDNIYSTSNQMRTYGTALKLPIIANPSTLYGSSMNSNSGYLNFLSSNYAIASSYPGNSLKLTPSRQSNYLLTSYGTPVTSYTIPSTNYGSPSNTQSVSNSNFNSQSSVSTISNEGSSSPDISTYSRSGNSYSTPSSSSSYQTDSSYKNTGHISSSINYSRPSRNYGSSNNSPSNNGNSILNYKTQSSVPTSSYSNSIENYSLQPSSNMYDTVSDSFNSYSNPSNRYFRYPASKSLPYLDSREYARESNYNTISYSVADRKY